MGLSDDSAFFFILIGVGGAELDDESNMVATSSIAKQVPTNRLQINVRENEKILTDAILNLFSMNCVPLYMTCNKCLSCPYFVYGDKKY